MKPIIVSPPFGNYIANSKVTSVLGSYTLKARHGRLLKVSQFVYDNLRHPVPGGYRNRIGLRNKGISSIGGLLEDAIYSFVGLDPYDWEAIRYVALEIPRWGKFRPIVELNISCPNVHDYSISRKVLEQYGEDFNVIVKLPPDQEKILPLVEMCGEAGVRFLHLSNTVPSEIGGLSGYPLKLINLPIVEMIARRYPNLRIIGGGGIYEWQDLLDYYRAGAIYFSTSTVWLKPWKARRIVKRYWDSSLAELNQQVYR